MFSKNLAIFLLVLATSHCSFIPISPPAPWQSALMARYIIHKSDWVSIATISTQKSIKGYPFVSLKSMSDGPGAINGTGVPYLYMTDMDVSGQDVKENNRCTIMATLAESDYCKTENFDPQDPRCAKVIITGKLIKLDNSSAEYKFGQAALYERHPSMKYWPKNHNFYVAKIDIEQIAVLDFFGGIKLVTVKDYFNAYNTSSNIYLNLILNNVEIVQIEV